MLMELRTLTPRCRVVRVVAVWSVLVAGGIASAVSTATAQTTTIPKTTTTTTTTSTTTLPGKLQAEIDKVDSLGEFIKGIGNCHVNDATRAWRRNAFQTKCDRKKNRRQKRC